jgi:hypothetical protein
MNSREELLEAAATAFRERDALGRILPSPAWADLNPDERAALFDLHEESRRLERLLDPRGLSTTGRAVFDRIRGIEQMT